ncbi:MAG: hypothetical protein Fur0010_07700 [Bdellovibrio sp.]
MFNRRSVKKIKVIKSKAKPYIGKNQIPIEILSALNKVMDQTLEKQIQERLKQIV